MTGLFTICRRRSFRFGLLFAAFLFAANGLLHPLFHGASCRGERRGALLLSASSRMDAAAPIAAADAGKLHCPVCSGIFHAAAPAEPFQPEIVILPEHRGLPLSDGFLPDALPASCRARAPPAA